MKTVGFKNCKTIDGCDKRKELGVEEVKYVKSSDEEYILDDGESINDLGKCKLQEAKKAAEHVAKKGNKVVFIMKTVGYIDPDL